MKTNISKARRLSVIIPLTLAIVIVFGILFANVIGDGSNSPDANTLNNKVDTPAFSDTKTDTVDVSANENETNTNTDSYVFTNVTSNTATIIPLSNLMLSMYSEDKCIIGDVNNDGWVNEADKDILGKYLAKWDIEINEKTADCNGDGTIDSVDAVLLSQYLAGWNIDFPEPPETNYTPGDVNNDGVVNKKDADALAKHLAGWDIEIHEDAADYYKDGIINSKDAVRLAQYLEGVNATTNDTNNNRSIQENNEENLNVGVSYAQTAKFTTIGYKWGDVNEDGYVDEDDFFDFLKHLLYLTGRNYEPLYNPDVADLDNDGRVTHKDGQLLYDYLEDHGINIY